MKPLTQTLCTWYNRAMFLNPKLDLLCEHDLERVVVPYFLSSDLPRPSPHEVADCLRHFADEIEGRAATRDQIESDPAFD